MKSKFNNRYSDKEIITYLKKTIRKNYGKPVPFKTLKKRNERPALTTIMNRFGTYTKAIRLAGYEKDMPGKYNIDSYFFNKINTEAKAYFLGFHVTDGNVHSRRSTFTILIAQEDKHILEELCIRMKTKKKLLYTKNKYKNRQNVVRFERGDKQICTDLIKMGYGPKKSLYTRYPKRKFLKSNLDRHFLRGVFDGDGSINKNQGRIDIYSGSQIFLKDLYNIFNEYLNISSSMKIEQRSDNRTSTRLRINSGKNKETTKKLFNFFYKNSDSKLRLKRKYNIFLKHARASK